MPEEKKLEKVGESLIAREGIEAVKIEKERAIEQKESGAERLSGGTSENSNGPIEKPSTSISAGSIVNASNIAAQFAAREKQIERILEAGMADMYQSLSVEKKIEFKTIGERTAREINDLLNQTKVNIKKIIDLILSWLLIIPGVNRFFLEQESKIKADEIIKLKMNNG